MSVTHPASREQDPAPGTRAPLGAPSGDTSDSSRLTPYLRWVLALILIADVLDLMDSTVTNIAAPSIVRDIGGGESLIKWLGAGYALSMGVLLVVGGRLGDRFGKRRMFLIGIAGFTLASLACGLAADPTMLITARLIQGGFGAMLIPQGIGILTTIFSREQIPTAVSLFGPVMGFSAVLGPIVAGLIISANIAGLGWRPIFLINIILGTVGFIAAWRMLPHDSGDRSEVIDIPGAGLLAAAMTGLMYGLITGSTNGWTATPIACLAGGLALLVAFGVNQRRAANPLIRPTLLKNQGFTAGLLLGLFYFATVNGFAYVASLFLQTGLGRSPSQAALGLAPLMAGIIIASFAGRPLIATLGRKLVFIGLAATLIGAAGMWATVHFGGLGISEWALAPSLLDSRCGHGARASPRSMTLRSATSPRMKPAAPVDRSAPCNSSPPRSVPRPSPPSTSPRSTMAEPRTPWPSASSSSPRSPRSASSPPGSFPSKRPTRSTDPAPRLTRRVLPVSADEHDAKRHHGICEGSQSGEVLLPTLSVVSNGTRHAFRNRLSMWNHDIMRTSLRQVVSS